MLKVWEAILKGVLFVVCGIAVFWNSSSRKLKYLMSRLKIF
jgi:hypothetical protein